MRRGSYKDIELEASLIKKGESSTRFTFKEEERGGGGVKSKDFSSRYIAVEAGKPAGSAATCAKFQKTIY